MSYTVHEPSQQDWDDYYEKVQKTGYAALPNCPRCRGAGFVIPRDDKGQPIFNKTIPCSYKDCLKDSHEKFRNGETYLKNIGIMDKTKTFGSWLHENGSEEAFKAFYNLSGLNPDIKYPPPLLMCYGPVGNGKTHLCNALALELHERKIGLRVYDVADMMMDLRIGIPDHTIDLKLRFLKSIPALIMDDWGVNYGTDWEWGKMDEIVTHRYRAEILTVFITNLDPTNVPERVLSRFSDTHLSVMVSNTGADHRPMI
jgi:DNA replication protein DnaC